MTLYSTSLEQTHRLEHPPCELPAPAARTERIMWTPDRLCTPVRRQERPRVQFTEIRGTAATSEYCFVLDGLEGVRVLDSELNRLSTLSVRYTSEMFSVCSAVHNPRPLVYMWVF